MHLTSLYSPLYLTYCTVRYALGLLLRLLAKREGAYRLNVVGCP